MFAPAMIAFAMQALPVAEAVNGQCAYSPELIERAERFGTVLTACNTFRRIDAGPDATFVFGRRSWNTSVRLTGTMRGNRMTVAQIQLANGQSLPATGDCEIYERNGKPDRVACLAQARGIDYVANFYRSRISAD